MEPISKKSGNTFRCEKRRKDKEHDEVVRKTTKLECFFTKISTNVESIPSNQERGSDILKSNTEIDKVQNNTQVIAEVQNVEIITEIQNNTEVIDEIDSAKVIDEGNNCVTVDQNGSDISCYSNQKLILICVLLYLY